MNYNGFSFFKYRQIYRLQNKCTRPVKKIIKLLVSSLTVPYKTTVKLDKVCRMKFKRIATSDENDGRRRRETSATSNINIHLTRSRQDTS